MGQSVAETVALWKKGAIAAAPKTKAKIMAMTESPMAKAATKESAMLAGVTDAVTSGRWREGLLAADFQAWKQKTAEAGTARIASGVEAASDKMTRFFTQLLPHAEQVSRTVQAMPSDTFEQRVQRAIAAMEGMHQFKFRKKG